MAECEYTETDLTADLAHRRTELGVYPASDPQSPPLARVIESILSAPATDTEAAEREAEARKRFGVWHELIRARGERYESCWLKNYAAESEAQQGAVETLTAYCREVAGRVSLGEGMLLFGPKGTGKDHLIVAVARAAIRAGKTVRWQNGMDLFGDVRDAIGNGDNEKSLISRLVSPDVLYLSDPLPPVGSLTEFQAAMLFRILDARYSRRKPTWVTVNVSSGTELDSRMGAQNGDRLRDGAIAIFCNWPSYRKVKQ